MAASMAKHTLSVPKHTFLYILTIRECHGLKICGNVQKSNQSGNKYLSSGGILQSRNYHRVSGESTFDSEADSHKVEDPSIPSDSRRPRRKYQIYRSRMRDKYNLKPAPEDRENSATNKVNTQHSVQYDDDVTQDFFGVLENPKTESHDEFFDARNKVQGSDFEQVAKRHPYLTSGPMRNTVKVYETSFGYMTFDGNRSKGKESFSKEEKTPNSEVIAEQNFTDEQYFGNINAFQNPSESAKTAVDNKSSGDFLSGNQNFDLPEGKHISKEITSGSQEQNFIDEQYFGKIGTFQTAPAKGEVESTNLPSGNDFFENQYFAPNQDSASPPWEKNSIDQKNSLENNHSSKGMTYANTENNLVANYGHKEDILQEQYLENYQSLIQDAVNDMENTKLSEHLTQIPSQDNTVPKILAEVQPYQKYTPKPDAVIIERKTKLEEKMDSQTKQKSSSSSSALNEALKIRQELTGKKMTESVNVTNAHPKLQKWRGEKDSKGFRKLKNQVLDIHNFPEEIVLNIMKDSILYENDEMLALYKPYGLPSHGGPGVHHSIGKLLPKLAKKLDRQLRDLHLVHRLDKETTGVMVIAKSDEMAWRLQGMFKKRQVVKKYWVLTKGVPHPSEGVIDIPMGETQVDKYHRMTLRPEYTEDTKLYMTNASKVKKQDALTNYKVLGSQSSVALVECNPESGVKHQIRCHLAFGLNTPILGDHKYSHVSKVAPQKLYPETLQKLGIRQATVRYLPMHLHAKSLVFPELLHGRNVFISARLPKYFIQNMKWLGIKIPE